LCAPCDRSGRSARPEVAPGLTPESIQPKYAQMVASTWIPSGCVQFLKNKKRFHTAWVKNGSVRARAARPFYPQEQTSSACPGMSVWCQKRKWLLLHSINSSVGQEVSEDVESTGIVDTITQTVPEGSPVGTVVEEEGYPPHLATSIFMIAAGGQFVG